MNAYRTAVMIKGVLEFGNNTPKKSFYVTNTNEFPESEHCSENTTKPIAF